MSTFARRPLTRVSLTLALLLGSHLAHAQGMGMADQSAFHAFGDKPGLVSLMEDFMGRLLVDTRTAPFFKSSNQERVKTQLVDQFCAALNGPCTYGGADMKIIHSQLGIHKAEFNALVEVLQQSMNAKGVPFGAQNQLLAKLAPLHRDIITAR